MTDRVQTKTRRSLWAGSTQRRLVLLVLSAMTLAYLDGIDDRNGNRIEGAVLARYAPASSNDGGTGVRNRL